MTSFPQWFPKFRTRVQQVRVASEALDNAFGFARPPGRTTRAPATRGATLATGRAEMAAGGRP
ncbi:MAG: hypothetical protein U0587_18980 [Candidatus Binatia bacterium]